MISEVDVRRRDLPQTNIVAEFYCDLAGRECSFRTDPQVRTWDETAKVLS
jgi:hypothetical protein